MVKKIQISKNTENAILFAAMTIFLLFILLSNNLTANDYFWHVKIGEYIAKNKTVPVSGIFSWSAQEAGLYWTSHEWLSEVIFYLVYLLGGNRAIYIMCMLMGMGLVILIAYQNKVYLKKNMLFTGFYSLLAAIIIFMAVTPRPQLFSGFLFFFLLQILYQYLQKDTKLLYLIPVIFVLWANLHGGMATLGYITLGVFIISTRIQIPFGRIETTVLPMKRWVKLISVSGASVLYMLINPNTYHIFSFVFNLMGDQVPMQLVSEWFAPDVKQFSHLICFIMVVITIISMITTKKNIRLHDLLLFLALFYLFMRSYRFSFYFVIASAFFVFHYIPKLMMESRIYNSVKNSKKILGILLPLLVICLFGINIRSYQGMKDSVLSQEAIQVLKDTGCKRMYNHYDLGGELIYNDFDVFIDGRGDMYQGEILNDFKDLTIDMTDADHIADIIEKYDFDCFVCMKAEQLNTYLNLTGNYDLIYQYSAINIYTPK